VNVGGRDGLPVEQFVNGPLGDDWEVWRSRRASRSWSLILPSQGWASALCSCRMYPYMLGWPQELTRTCGPACRTPLDVA
jgi:hypothetical protein